MQTLLLGSQFCSISLYVYFLPVWYHFKYYSFIVSFKIRRCHVSSSVLSRCTFWDSLRPCMYVWAPYFLFLLVAEFLGLYILDLTTHEAGCWKASLLFSQKWHYSSRWRFFPGPQTSLCAPCLPELSQPSSEVHREEASHRAGEGIAWHLGAGVSLGHLKGICGWGFSHNYQWGLCS